MAKASAKKKVAPKSKGKPAKKAAPAKKAKQKPVKIKVAAKKPAPKSKVVTAKKVGKSAKLKTAPAAKPTKSVAAAAVTSKPAKLLTQKGANPQNLKTDKPIKKELNASPTSKATASEPAVRGAVSQISETKAKPIVIPEHLKKLQRQLDGLVEKTSPEESGTEPTRTPASDIFSDAELGQFLAALQEERSKLLVKAREAVDSGNIALDKDEMYDEVDLASATVDQNLTFRLLDRDRKLLNEIDHAISKIHSGDYGLCEGTGEPIPKRRLELRPWCKYSVKYKEQLERLKKSGRGVVDEDEDMFA
jgi:DnaK suppressor protein